jgi:hypothetical protein
MIDMENYMKMFPTMVVGTVALLAAGMPLAQDAKAPAAHTHAAGMQSGAAMNMSTQMGQMDEHMKKMQALHDRLVNASTPDERQKVMDEQRQEMQACMGMMNQMQGGPMMGGMGSGTMGQKSTPADAKAQMQMMQKRMDMMQMMMQSMMDQQGMMAGAKGANAAPMK